MALRLSGPPPLPARSARNFTGLKADIRQELSVGLPDVLSAHERQMALFLDFLDTVEESAEGG